MKCVELVILDHMAIRRGLSILDGMMKKLEEGERIEISDIKAMLTFLQMFGDDYHQTVEEKILFPALVRAAAKDSPVHQMVLQHGEERALMSWIIDAFASKRVVDFVYSCGRLSVLLRAHMDKEETVLCDLAGGLLSVDEDAAIVAAFRTSYRQPEFYVDLSRLERKYTPAVLEKLVVQTHGHNGSRGLYTKLPS